jgi:hypothetical protein
LTVSVFRHIRLRLVAPVVIAALAAATVAAFAAGLGGLSADDLGGGSDAVESCDSDGFTPSYTTSAGNVTAVTIDGIADPGCEGGSLYVTLADSTGAGIGSGGPQIISTDGDALDNSATVSLTPQPAGSQVTRIHVAVTGP